MTIGRDDSELEKELNRRISMHSIARIRALLSRDPDVEYVNYAIQIMKRILEKE